MQSNSSVDIGLWSAGFNDITGQALVTKHVVESVLPQLGRHKVYTYQSGFSIGSIATWIATALLLWRDVSNGTTRMLYVVCSRSNFGFLRDLPALLIAVLGHRVIVHVHGSDVVGLLSNRLLSALARAIYQKCEVIVPSEHLVPELIGLVRKIYVCENFNVMFRTEASSELSRARDGSFSVLWNSNIMSSKGIFDVVEATTQMHLEGKRVALHVIGAVVGDEELSADEAERKVRSFCNSEHIVLHGPLPVVETTALLKNADVVVLPSRYSSECQPLSVISAMCAGKSIIVSDTKAMRATVGIYPVKFVRVRSLEDLKMALEQVLREAALNDESASCRMREFAVNSQQRFSVQRFNDEIRSILAAK